MENKLSDEPNLGMWKIFIIENNDSTINSNVDGQSISFEVKKYALPKFEVNLNHLNKIRIDEKQISVTVCAK